MKRSDPSLLSAYLDDELEPSARLRLEAALETDPGLARELRDLERLREVLGALPRPPAPNGVAFRVLSRIEQAEAQRLRRRSERRVQLRRVLVLAPITAAAAMLLLVWSIENFNRPDPPVPRRVVVPPSDLARNAPEAQAEPDAVAEVASTNPTPSTPSPLTLTADERARLQGQAQLLDLLGRPRAERIVLTVPSLDEPNLARVEAVLGEVVRSDPRHARLRVPAGLAIDPSHPGAAVVFAVPLEETEPKRFLDHLGRRFPGRLLEARPVPPGVLAQLGETVGFEFGEDQALAAAPLVETDEHILHANKAEAPRVHTEIRVVGPPGVEIVAPPAEAPAEPAPTPPAEAAPATTGPAVYLVWVVAG